LPPVATARLHKGSIFCCPYWLLKLAVDALHDAVFYRLLLSGEPLDADFADRLAEQALAGLAAR
jgi:hypothetical protein